MPRAKGRLGIRPGGAGESYLSLVPTAAGGSANVDDGKRIAELAIQQPLTRMKSAQKVEKRKGSGVSLLPRKLTDCESDDVSRHEVFLVNGDPARGSAKDRNLIVS